MTAILGISAFYHDSAAALLIDGNIVAAAQEERFTRIKHDPSFPAHAIKFCLTQAGIGVDDLDHVAFYEKPFLKFERLLETYLNHAPRGLDSFLTSMPIWLRSKLYLSSAIRRGLSELPPIGMELNPGKKFGGQYQKRIVFPQHHQSHAASAFFPSPFEQAAILTVDGVGEWATSTMGTGIGNTIELSHEVRFPHSLGLLYSAFTYFCGFHPNGGEGKLMGLAPYGKPIYQQQILDQIIDVKGDGSLRLDQSFFNYCTGRTMTSTKFDQLFGGPPRRPEAEITDRERNLAASIQSVTETIILRMAKHLHETTGMKNLCVAGGVGLNCVANGRLRREGPFENIWTQPAAGDSGGAIGAGLFVWHQLLEREREPSRTSTMSLGPSYDSIDQKKKTTDILDQFGAKYEQFDELSELQETVATLLNSQQTVGWFQGRMEFGPRALGNRSILADPRDPAMQDKLNRQVKFREPFRPFAPVILREQYDRFFDVKNKDHDSPFMLFASQTVVDPKTLPAVTHVDGSARVQTVTQLDNDRLYGLIKTFEQLTNCPLLLNTSFNVRGKPIVCTPADAIQCFFESGLDTLVIEDILLHKSEQTNSQMSNNNGGNNLGQMVDSVQRSHFPSVLNKIKNFGLAITFPIRYLVSTVILTAIYFALITPIGIIARQRKRSFQTIDHEARTYWETRPVLPDKTGYLKQY